MPKPTTLLYQTFRPLWQCWLDATAPKPDMPAPKMRQPFIVVGLFRSATGIGESARLGYNALASLDLDVQAFDLSAALRQTDLALPSLLGEAKPWPDKGTLILHLNAPLMARALSLLGKDKIKNKRIIGRFAWELPEVPADWIDGMRRVHEIWTCSEFSAAALRKKTNTPVKVVPHVVHAPRNTDPATISHTLEEPHHSSPHTGERRYPESYKTLGMALETLDSGLRRNEVFYLRDQLSDCERRTIQPEQFVVLAMANADSSLERKNPLGAIAAFKQAFGDDPNALLVLKVGRLETAKHVEANLRAAIGLAKNIQLLTETLETKDRFSLMQRVNVVLALHRAEGFGLVLAEAMAFGKPVIATAWSGNLDFMNEQNAALVPAKSVPVQDPSGIYPAQSGNTLLYWAEPDREAAVTWLKRLKAEPQLAAAIGAKAKETMAYERLLQHFKRQIGA